MKMNKVYLESSALWNVYYDEAGAEIVEHVLGNREYTCISSIWSVLELHRGVKKRENQKEMDEGEASNLRTFIDTDLKQLELAGRLSLKPISPDSISLAKKLINDHNLYSSDALQLATAIQDGCSTIIVDDFHHERLSARISSEYGLRVVPTSAGIPGL
jgi:predicted nucleic acid-binding protein